MLIDSNLNYWVAIGVLTCLLLIALFRLILVGPKLNALKYNVRSLRLEKRQDVSDWMLLVIKQLANELILRDREGYLSVCETLFADWQKLKQASTEAKLSKLKEITDAYPSYVSFDETNGDWPHVLNVDSFSCVDTETLFETYSSLRLFLALKSELHDQDLKEWTHKTTIESITAREIEKVRTYVAQLNDYEFLETLHLGVGQYEAIEANLKDDEHISYDEPIETREFTLRRLPFELSNMLEVRRIGVYSKSLDRYGLFTVDCSDEGRVYEHFYISNHDFSEEKSFDIRAYLEGSIRRNEISAFYGSRERRA